MSAVLALIVVGVAAWALLWQGRCARGAEGTRSYLAAQRRYQPAALLIAVASVLAVQALVPDHGNYLAWGDLSAPATGLGLLGVSEGDSWATVGLTFLVIMTVVTAVVVWFQVGRGTKSAALVRALGWAIPISIFNALSEELIFRVALTEGLAPSLLPTAGAAVIAGIGAAAFAIPHWWGTPGRIPGLLLAGFMGWFLTMSVLQTQGIGWAWIIHVVQDLVIVTMLISKAESPRQPRSQ